MPYPPDSVANFFIEKASEGRESLDPMKLQKLVYFANGWSLGVRGERLINEPIQAWDFGPVVPSLYRRLKHYGSGQVTQLLTFTEDGQSFHCRSVNNPNDVEFLDRIWNVYGKQTGLQLSELTHRANTPWSETRRLSNGAREAVIEDSLMRDYFKQLAEQNAARRPVTA